MSPEQIPEQIIAAWGPLAVLAGCFAEGEAAALAGGMIAHRGLAGWLLIATMAAAGAFASDQLWFHMSRHASGSWLMQRMRARLAGADRLPQTGGPLAISFRFIPGLRILGPVVLAQSGMGAARFLLLDGLACTLWALVWTGIGYHFGRAAEAVLGRLASHHWLILLGVLVALAVLAQRHIARSR